MVWGPWTLVIFLGVGIFFTLRCHFFQIRGFLFWWSRTAGRLISGEASRKEDGNKTGKGKGISQFQSVCTALAATVGTGNIAGVATALTAGGPGALFWMWVSALIGMITAYAETMLGIRYRYRDKDGHYICGPFIYMERGLGLRGMGVLYSFLCLMSSLGMGSMVQANSAISTMEYTWHVPALAGGLIFTGLLVLVTWGGIRRIGNVAEKLVPAASGIYIAFSMIVILSCLEQIPGALVSMVSSAFLPEAAAGGTAGYVISRSVRYGISRGVFSNEAGLGTLAVLHGPTEGTTPHEQGMWAMFEVFFDTVVFAFATIMAWFYLGRQAAAYFIRGCGFGENAQRMFSAKVYPLLFIAAVFLGSEARLGLVWLLSDVWNGLMAFPNLTALLFLSREVTLPEGFLRRRD